MVIKIFLRISWWIESLKEQHLFEIEIFCYIEFLLSFFYQFNVSLQNNIIQFLKIYIYIIDSNILNSSVFIQPNMATLAQPMAFLIFIFIWNICWLVDQYCDFSLIDSIIYSHYPKITF